MVLSSALVATSASSSSSSRMIRIMANAAATSKRITAIPAVMPMFQQQPQQRKFATNSQKKDKSNNDTSFFANLRWKAAEVLTASLEESEKHKLLENLNAVPKAEQQQQQQQQQPDKVGAKKEEEEEDDLLAKSIGEAVAAARAQEAQENQSKWEREKASIMKQAEEAAMARVENELRIQERRLALEKWERELKQEEQEQEGNAQKEIVKEAELVNENTNNASVEIVQDDDDHHPVLGPALIDLGHKRIHIVSAQALASIPIWKKQRIYRHERAKIMANDKLKTVGLGLPGIIALHENEQGKLSILDGQHRVGMMTILDELLEVKQDGSVVTNSSFDLNRILVEVFPHTADTNFTAQDIFTEINKAEPVKLVDMPGVASKTHRKLITDTAAKLKDTFPDMFKPSQNCRAPHVNIDNLRDALFASDVLKRHSIKSQKAFMTWIMDQNESLKVKFEKEPPTNASKTAYAKAIKYNFFLGLESSWLYN